MLRTLAVVLLYIPLLTAAAPAQDCPPPSDNCAVVNPVSCISSVHCSMDAEWFAKYEGCSTKHFPIRVTQYFPFTLFTSNRQFKVEQFKKGVPNGNDCDLSHAMPVPDFDEPPSTYGQILPVHNMTPSVVGCYAVTIQFADGCRVDPHIIVGGYNPNVLEDLNKCKK